MPIDSSPDHPRPLREIAQAVKGWVERLGWVWVEAQIVQINRRAGTKTVFLTLRDPLAEVSVSVTIAPADLDAAGPLTEGTTVAAHLRPMYWTPTGRLSYVCDQLRAQGEGRLLAQLEQRKRMLQAEGLFDPVRKRRPPFLPQAVGLVTAAGSAAERDVIDNARRRWPAVQIVVRHALVQGPQSARELMEALSGLDRDPRVEVIVIARGGGSVEDLLPFSDEGLVRAVAACGTPVVSAIGHETDSPILDLVADVRASTPTDAAKRVVPDAREEADRVRQARDRVRRALDRTLVVERDRLQTLRSRPVLQDPTATFTLRRAELETARARLLRGVGQRIVTERTFIAHQRSRARAMSPEATLARGYAILATAEGATLASVTQASAGDAVTAHLHDGRLDLDVTGVHEPESHEPESREPAISEKENHE